jgi:hypothetical protein
VEASRVDSFLNGLLLGDCGIFRAKETHNAYFRQTCHHKEYLEHIYENLKEDIPFSDSPFLYRSTHDTWTLTSRNSEYLTSKRVLWYPEGIKIVPSSLILDKDALCNWYLGDGCLASKRGCHAGIELASHAFSLEDRQFLVAQLRELGFSSTAWKSGVNIIHKKSIVDFLTYLGSCPVKCYEYKWDIERFSFKYPYTYAYRKQKRLEKEGILSREVKDEDIVYSLQ